MVNNPIEGYLKDLAEPKISTVAIVTNKSVDGLEPSDDSLATHTDSVPSTLTIASLAPESEPELMTREEETVEASDVYHNDDNVDDQFRVLEAPPQPFSFSNNYSDSVKIFTINDAFVSKWK